MRFLDSMRERPEEERMVFAASAAVGVALILFVVWMVVFFQGNSENTAARIVPESQQASVIESLRDSGDEISSAFGEVSGQYEDLRALLEEAQQNNEIPPFETRVELTANEDGEVESQNVIVPQSEGAQQP